MQLWGGRPTMQLPVSSESGTLRSFRQERKPVPQTLRDLIRFSEPDAVLLAGDLVDDVFGPRERYWRMLHSFLAFLSKRDIPVLVVRGNKDDERFYEQACNVPGVHEISDRVFAFGGLRFLGVSHQATRDLRYMRRLHSVHSGRIDIVLAHAEYRRRPWLFMLDTRLVVTGHFDTRLSSIRGVALLSMWSSPSQYALIETRGHDWRTTLVVDSPNDTPLAVPVQVAKAMECRRDRSRSPSQGLPKAVGCLRRGRLTVMIQPRVFPMLAFRPNYVEEVAALLDARTRLVRELSSRAEEEKRLSKLGVPRTQITEVLRGIGE